MFLERRVKSVAFHKRELVSKRRPAPLRGSAEGTLRTISRTRRGGGVFRPPSPTRRADGPTLIRDGSYFQGTKRKTKDENRYYSVYNVNEFF
jgi:hypothetical protein